MDISHEKLDKPFTYRIPQELAGCITTGTAVNIPFGRGNALRKGYVIDVRETADTDYDESKIKEIRSLAEKSVDAESELMQLAGWMKDHYGSTFVRCLKTVLPVSRKMKARSATSPLKRHPHRYSLHTPNADQQRIIDRFTQDFDAGKRGTYLLYGVTGSGKTDAYMHMIRHVLDAGKQVILLIPEISLTYQAIDRLYATFGDRVAIIHSKLTGGEKYEQFRRCESGEADILIGPRSALFAPFSDIGLIIIDEEHDSAYKNENVPRYQSAEVAQERARVHNADVLLCSATPTPGSFQKALTGEYTLLELPERTAGASLPETEVIDLRQEMLEGNRSIFSRRLQELMNDRLSRKEQIILFMNRRGYSNFVSCRSCGEAIKCPHCDISLTLHKNFHLICHYCGYSMEMPKLCPACGSPYIAEFGVGTQKLETITKRMFPEARVARLDTDSTVRKNAGEEILADFAAGKTDILIGTQMVVKGHDYHNVTLVGIMAADTSLYVDDYTAGQRTFELISQAAGRAGRGGKPGTVVVQTYKPEHYAITSAAGGDYAAYYENEMAFRKLLRYPPAMHIMTVQLSSSDEEELCRTAEAYARVTSAAAARYGAEQIGPVNASVYKVNDYFRKLTYIKHKDYDILLKIKKEVEAELGNRGIRISALYDFT